MWMCVLLTLRRPPLLLVWPNTFSKVHSCRGYMCWPTNLSPLLSCRGLQRLACSSTSENRKNILGLASAPLAGTTFSQPSRMYHLPMRRGRKRQEQEVRLSFQQSHGLQGSWWTGNTVVRMSGYQNSENMTILVEYQRCHRYWTCDSSGTEEGSIKACRCSSLTSERRRRQVGRENDMNSTWNSSKCRCSNRSAATQNKHLNRSDRHPLRFEEGANTDVLKPVVIVTTRGWPQKRVNLNFKTVVNKFRSWNVTGFVCCELQQLTCGAQQSGRCYIKTILWCTAHFQILAG